MRTVVYVRPLRAGRVLVRAARAGQRRGAALACRSRWALPVPELPRADRGL